MKKSSFLHKIELGLLVLFFLASAVMTYGSQANYMRRLTVVEVMQPYAGFVEHHMSYPGRMICENGLYKIQFTADLYAELLVQETPPEMEVAKVSYFFERDAQENLELKMTLGESIRNPLERVEDGNLGVIILKDLPEGWSSKDEYIVSLDIFGTKKMNIVDTSCIWYDAGEGKNYVYTIVEEKKIWGTEYRLYRREVTVEETNGVVSAIKNRPYEPIVKNVSDSWYHGMLVRYETEL